MTRYFIIGNGAAGTEAALTIRKHDETSPITIITESHYLHYFRPKLVHFLAEETSPDDLIVYDDDFYREKDIYHILGRKIVRIDAGKQRIVDSFGGEYPYDKLLIATGSVPILPPIEGITRQGVFTLRSVSDAKRIKRYSQEIKNIVVLGGGLLGLENAFSLLQLGKDVTVVESAAWLLPRQLDAQGGRHLQKLLEAKGLKFVLGDQVEKIDGLGDRTEAVVLKSGLTLKTETVLVSAGVRGDLEFLRDSPIKTNRGIIVDDFLSTSVGGIWAAGDVAEHRGVTYGLWPIAREQGRAAGLNMAGIPASYLGSIPSSLLKITGIPVFSMGYVGDADNGRADTRVFSADTASSYKKLRVSEGKAVSAMVIGDNDAIRKARKIMAGEQSPETFEDGLAQRPAKQP